MFEIALSGRRFLQDVPDCLPDGDARRRFPWSGLRRGRLVATPASKPAAHDVELTGKASFPQFSP